MLGRQLWSLMMDPATEPDPVVVEAINRLRGTSFPAPLPPVDFLILSRHAASRRFKVAALTNNFSAPGSTPSRHPPSPPFVRGTSAAELKAALKATAAEGQGGKKGTSNTVIKEMFDVFVESCVEGVRCVLLSFFSSSCCFLLSSRVPDLS